MRSCRMMGRIHEVVRDALDNEDPDAIVSTLASIEEAAAAIEEQIRALAEQREELATHERRLRERLVESAA